MDCLKVCDKVCFTVYGNERISGRIVGTISSKYGCLWICHLVENQEAKMMLIKKFAMKYYPDEKLVDEEAASSGRAVQNVRN